MSKGIEDLNNAINQLNLKDTYRTLHLTRAEHTFFSNTHETSPGWTISHFVVVVVVQSLILAQLFATPWTVAHQASLGLSLSPRICSNTCPLSQWRHPTISSSVTHFSSCPQSFPASGSFPMSRLIASGGQSVGASASAPIFPMNINKSLCYTSETKTTL